MIKYIYVLIALLSLISCKEATEFKSNKQVLPIFGEKKLGGVDGTDTLYHTVQSFSFINQYHDTVSNKTVDGKIYVADFFFATCQSICPKMSSQLALVQGAFKDDNEVLLLSHTVNPMHDTVEVLYGYAQSYGAIKNKWHFLTGNKKQIYDIAYKDYLVNALEDDGSEEGFLHSELFVLVDKQKRIRGVYDGTDSVAVSKLISDIRLLKQE